MFKLKITMWKLINKKISRKDKLVKFSRSDLMNTLKIVAWHKAFKTYYFQPFEFTYQNITIRLEIKNRKIIITLSGRKSIEEIWKIYFKVYDLLFLFLGAFPKQERVLANDVEINMSERIRKYDTSSVYIEKEL